MILSDTAILAAIRRGEIVIDPFDLANLGSNSYDVHLGNTLAVYQDQVLDARKSNAIKYITIDSDGYELQPNRLYLGVTAEYTETHNYVPFLEGKSSTGRLGINIHATAGKGDVGFCNTWTLEISVIQPVRIYAGMPIAQLIYFKLEGEVRCSYSQKTTAKYSQKTSLPQGSAMWRNFGVD